MGSYEEVKEWRKKNKDKVNEQARRYRKKHPETSKKARKKYREKRLPEIRIKEAKYAMMKRKKYPEAQKIRNLRFKARMEEKKVVLAGRPRPETCELCKEINENFTFSKYKTLFDHDHITGKFRGWICDRCNKVLGLINDNPNLLREMINYLEKNE